MAASDQTTDAQDAGSSRPPRFGLSGRLLLLTTLFVIVAGVFIYVPSIANYRIMWINDRLAAAHTAALVLEAAPSGMVPESLAQQILDSIGAKQVAMKMGQQRRLLATSAMLADVTQDIDVRDVAPTMAVIDAFKTLLDNGNELIRAVGPAPMGGEFVEIVLEERPLRHAMWVYSRNFLLPLLAISAFTAALIYLALHYLFVRPMHRMTTNMMAFRRDPENPARIITPSRRRDEIGIAQRELAEMQGNLASMLQQKNHLAALGLAVSKINHDLRNLLTSAQLFSDRLSHVPDPRVQQFAPKLMRALERAIVFCQSTLNYGRVQEAPPDRKPVSFEALIEEVRETLGAGPEAGIRWIYSIERGLTVDADHDQLLRLMINLARNAMQAMESRTPNDPARDQIRITGRREGAVAVIEVSDTGPGVAEKARAHLFEAFQGSTRTGGSGLGLAIAAELVRAHGGEIRLVDGTIGATFRLTIPDRAVDLAAMRDERARG